MKLPRYILKIGGHEYLIANKNGVGALTELLADAMPVWARLYEDPPVIQLDHLDDPQMLAAYKRVECIPIPGNVRYERKAKTGEVQVVRPVEKPAKALKAPKAKALPAPKRAALPPPTPQLELI